MQQRPIIFMDGPISGDLSDVLAWAIRTAALVYQTGYPPHAWTVDGLALAIRLGR